MDIIGGSEGGDCLTTTDYWHGGSWGKTGKNGGIDTGLGLQPVKTKPCWLYTENDAVKEASREVAGDM